MNEKSQDAARDAGLDRIAAQFPEDVARAYAFANTLSERLPRDILPVDEPAHVYRVATGDENR